MQKILYIFKVLRERGVGFFYTYFMESMLFDLRNGTTTSSRVPKTDQNIDSSETEAENGLLYVASFTSVTQKTLTIARQLLGETRFNDSQFIDLGCGKSKTLILYAQTYGAQATHPALGIEYDPDLIEVAKANVAKCGFGPDRIELVADSATNLDAYARSETLVIYLYNSFQGETLREVLTLLKARPHVLIYVDPAERHVLPEFGYTIERENKGRYNADTWLVASANLQ